MTKIINLIGASGVGKTTIAKELEKKGYNIIHSYTTREPREENEWGHRFIGVEWFHDMKMKRSPMIAYEELYGNIYFATDEQVERNKTNIYVVTPNGAEQVKQYYRDTDIEVVSIYLAADKLVRRERMMERRCGASCEVLIEILQAREVADERIKRDTDIFNIVAADYVIDANRSIEEVLKDLVGIIDD